MKTYTFNKTDKGYIGNAFEMAIKDALHSKNADRVSPAGKTDLRYGKYYDIKQNGTVLQYDAESGMIHGSSRVIYATHVAHTVVAETETTISIQIRLDETDMFCLDKKTFLNYLLSEKGFCKYNAERGQVNIQTLYNYKKDAYHGKKGKTLEAWMELNRLVEDSIVEDILDGYYASL